MRIGVVAIALSMACGPLLQAALTQRSGNDQNLSGTTGYGQGGKQMAVSVRCISP